MSGFLSGWNLLPQVPGALDTAISKVVRKAAFDIQRAAMQLAPVDTGFLKASIYTVTVKPDGTTSSTYSAADTRTANKNPLGEMLPEIDAPPSPRTAYVAVGAEYGIYVEMGTMHGPAQPYLTPAAEIVRPQYLAAMAKLEGLLMTALGGGGSISTGVASLGEDGSYGLGGVSGVSPETDEEPF